MKTKLMFFAAIAALMLAGCSKERETPTPPPTPDEEQYDIYVSGSLYNRKTEINSYLKKGQWYDLALPDDDDFYYTQAIALDEGKVYVALNHGGGDKATGYCIDGVWHANQMPDGAEPTSYSLGILDGSVYMAGYCYYTETHASVACYWKDGVCHPLAIPDFSGSTSATGLAVSGGSVYIAGHGDKNFGYWKDGVWNPLPLPDGSSYAYGSIACSEGSVYVLGNTSIDQIYLWVDGVAQILSAPDGLSIWGNKIAVADGSVYIAGYYRDNDNSEYACYWKDGVFHKLDAPGTSSTEDIAVADGAVFIAGNYYEFSDRESVGCYWKDGVRVDIPTPEGMKLRVSGMAVAKTQ